MDYEVVLDSVSTPDSVWIRIQGDKEASQGFIHPGRERGRGRWRGDE